ncbi:MAG: hypothetical protein ACFFAJ_18340 [Candidatus Hodarchaeota archaeon]
MNIKLRKLRNEKNMRERLVKISFLTLMLIFVSLGVITPSNAAISATMKLEIDWEVTFGGIGKDEPRGLVQTSDGGFAVISSKEDSYSRLVKFTANGQQEWNTTIIETLGWSRALVQTSDDGYVVVGRRGVFGQDADVLLRKFNSKGKPEWNITFGGEKSDWINSFIIAKDGGLILAGGTNYNGSAEGELWRAYDMWLVKTDSQGVPEWNRSFGGELSEVASTVIQTSDGGYAIAGRTDSYGQGMGNDDAWLVKTDASGQPEWNKTFDCGMFSSMIQIADGSYVFGGEHYQVLNNDIYLLKADSNGNQIWYHNYHNMPEDKFNYLIHTNDGGYLLAGNTGVTYEANHDLWFVKTDTNGNHEWNATLGDSEDQRLDSVIQLSDGSLVITATSGSESWLFKAQVVEDTASDTPGFEFEVLVLCLTFLFFISRKRGQ